MLNGHQRLSTAFNGAQRLTTVLNGSQRRATAAFNGSERFSTVVERRLPFDAPLLAADVSPLRLPTHTPEALARKA